MDIFRYYAWPSMARDLFGRRGDDMTPLRIGDRVELQRVRGDVVGRAVGGHVIRWDGPTRRESFIHDDWYRIGHMRRLSVLDLVAESVGEIDHEHGQRK